LNPPVNDPHVSAALRAWRPHIDGPPRLAHQVFAWDRPSAQEQPAG